MPRLHYSALKTEAAPSSGTLLNIHQLIQFYPESGGNIFLRNVGKYSLGFKASYSLKVTAKRALKKHEVLSWINATEDMGNGEERERKMRKKTKSDRLD
jgi:hypothetical protein